MITLGKVESNNDLLQIRQLNQNNLKKNLTEEDKLEHGFLTLDYNLDLLKSVNKIEKSIVARDNELVIGYAIVINKSVYGLHNLFDDLIDRLNLLTFNSKKLKNIEYALVGQLCVQKEYRGMGVVKKIYDFYKKEYSKKYQYLVTDVDEKNKRSLSAHLKIGFQIIDSFYWGESDWNIILWDWNNEN
jgi:ribosomal protein S18 acetylase RimI-like enzyme